MRADHPAADAAPALFSCFALIFISFFKEYSTAIFLFAPGSEVIGISILQFWDQGEMGGWRRWPPMQIVLMVVFIYSCARSCSE